MTSREHILFETDTAVDHYAVVERTYEGRPARVLFSGNRKAAQSGISLDDNPDLLFDYNQRMLELANNLYPKRILVIGGGACTLPMALSAALPDALVEVVELDPGLQSIAEQYFGLQLTNALQLYFGDGRVYLTAAKHTYDLIIVDVFSELAIPLQFLTLEFTELVYSKLNAGGCLVMNIIASYQGRNTSLIRSQIAAYNQSFDRFEIFPAGYGLTSWLPQNLVMVAQKHPVQDMTHMIRYAAINQPEADMTDIRYDKDITVAA